jgi:hypothetical protein
MRHYTSPIPQFLLTKIVKYSKFNWNAIKLLPTYDKKRRKMVDPNDNSQMRSSENPDSEQQQPIPGGPPLREMQFSDILDTTFSLYRNNFRLFIGITAILHVPLGILQILFTSKEGMFGIMFTALVDTLVINPIVTGALVFAVSQEYLGRQTTVKEALNRVKFLLILGVSLVWSILIIIMGITIVGLPFSIYFAVCWSLYIQAIMVEDHTVIGALSRSRQLVKGMWWRVLGIQIVLILLTAAAMFIPLFTLGMFIGILGGDFSLEYALEVILETILSIIITPIPLIGATLLYFDLRIRKEAFDIEMMARNIHQRV